MAQNPSGNNLEIGNRGQGTLNAVAKAAEMLAQEALFSLENNPDGS